MSCPICGEFRLRLHPETDYWECHSCGANGDDRTELHKTFTVLVRFIVNAKTANDAAGDVHGRLELVQGVDEVWATEDDGR